MHRESRGVQEYSRQDTEVVRENRTWIIKAEGIREVTEASCLSCRWADWVLERQVVEQTPNFRQSIPPCSPLSSSHSFISMSRNHSWTANKLPSDLIKACLLTCHLPVHNLQTLHCPSNKTNAIRAPWNLALQPYLSLLSPTYCTLQKIVLFLVLPLWNVGGNLLIPEGIIQLPPFSQNLPSPQEGLALLSLPFVLLYSTCHIHSL
jgi:hypothetical protein